jgi:septation ring formation regulator EzrA
LESNSEGELLMSLKKLEKRVAELEHKIEDLLRLVDMEKAPFSYLVLESNLTSNQVDGIYDLMDDFRNYIRAGHKIKHPDFEEELYKIVPSKQTDYHFAQDVVSSLNDEGRYTDVYKALKKSGMNI